MALGLAQLLVCALGGAPTMWLQPVVDIDPLAVCNDGSPAGYYVIPATTQPDLFLLYLEGGMCVAFGVALRCSVALPSIPPLA